MDYKNNVHFIDQDQKTIDIFKSDIWENFFYFTVFDKFFFWIKDH
jgi:hypothetical protein